METNSKFVNLVRARVNVHGELHLDKVLTDLLLNYLDHSETSLENFHKQFKELTELFRPIMDWKPDERK